MFSRMVASQVKHNSYFLCGLAIGLWLALVAVPLEDEVAEVACEGRGGIRGSVSSELPDDDLGTQAPLKQAEGAGARGEVRPLQRPRYYTTELGIRAPLLVAILTSEEELDGRVPALNTSLSSLGASVRWFLCARSAVPPRQGLVAFTDTREMLRPFHVIKYLADNHLEDYDFFFLAPDSSFVNGRALSALVRGLGVSGHVYMGAKADDDSEYCSLEGGILVSRSVLAAVHSSLDWCVRNSYSARHHENLGRCVLHATGRPAHHTHKGMEYISVPFSSRWNAAEAVTVTGVQNAEQIHQIHAHVARLGLELVQASIKGLSRAVSGRTRWPAGLRTEVGLPEAPPDNRFDVFRWSFSNGSHWLMPDEERAVAKLPHVYKKALDRVVSRAKCYLSSRHAGSLSLQEAAWLWRPATDLSYRLLFSKDQDGRKSLVSAEVSLSVGAARLVPVPYVTESARVTLLLPTTEGRLPACRVPLSNTRRIIVSLYKNESEMASLLPALRSSFLSLPPQCRAGAEVLGAVVGAGEGAGQGAGCAGQGAALRAARGAAGGVGGDSLVLLEGEGVEYTEEFLNRVRMNCVPGVSWFLPSPRARAPLSAAPARFSTHHNSVYAFYYKDYELARAMSPEECPLPALLRSPLRALRAPEPSLWRAPSPRPSGPAPRPSDPAHSPAPRPPPSPALALGSRTALANELLQREAGVHPD